MPLNHQFISTLADAVAERLGTDFVAEIADQVSRSIDVSTSEIADKIAEGIDTDDVANEAVEKVVDSLNTHRMESDIYDSVVERVTEDIDTDRIARKIIAYLVEDEEFKDKIVEAIMEQLTEPEHVNVAVSPDSSVPGLMRALGVESEEQIERRITAPVVGIGHSEESTPAPSCTRCGGATFLHREGLCPLEPAYPNGDHA